MESTTFGLDGWQLVSVIGIFSIAAGFLMLVFAVGVIPQWRKVRLLEAEMKLKQELVTAGHSADDIVRIIQSSTNGSRCATYARPVDPGMGRDVRPAARDAIRAEM